MQDVAGDYHALAVKRNVVIEDIRRLEGFEEFLLPKPFSKLVQAADKVQGPIIIINATTDRCDALILRPVFPDGVQHVPLSDMSVAKAIALLNILESLLPGYVPIIDNLGDRSNVTDLKCLKAVRRSDLDIPEQSFPCVLFSLWKWVVEPVVKALALTVSVIRLVTWRH